MKKIFLLLLCTVITATHVDAMSPGEARHLLMRTGYGVDATQWAAIINLEYDDAVDLIVDQASSASKPKPLDWIDDKPYYTISQKGWSTEQRKQLRIKKRKLIAELKMWWLQQMFTSRTPLQERMVMFWSNHFTTEFVKIQYPVLIHQQHDMYRQHAMSRFDVFLHEVLRNPAMLLYLDNDKNNKNRINENLARELLELFTLGEGNYTEQDIKEAARCLTGWGVDRDTGRFALRLNRHDQKNKQLLGERGNFDGDGLAEILLENPQTAEFIVTKLWLEFVSLEPDAQQVALWAKQFRENEYRVDVLLRTIFKSSAFRDPAHRGVLVRSPTELLAGLIRPAIDGLPRGQAVRRISDSTVGKRLLRPSKLGGQDLFNPPNVKGWPGGMKWIDSRTLLMREQTARNIVLALLSKEEYGNAYLQKLAWPEGAPKVKTQLMWHLNALDPVVEIPVTYAPKRTLLEVVRDPSVHLK